MDVAKSNQVGLDPLKSELNRIDGISDMQSALDTAFELQHLGIDAFFSFDVSQDEKLSSQMAVHLSQGGLGLPERDYYFNKEAGVTKIRAEYLIYLQQVLESLGTPDPQAAAVDVMAFETELAKASRRLEDRRDPRHNYNKMTVEQVQSNLTPSIAWQTRFSAWKLNPKSVIVGQPEFYKALDGLLAKTKTDTLRDYLRCRLVSAYAEYLDEKTAKMAFHFNGQILSGQKEMQPRWKRVLGAENQAIGFLLGRSFVKEYFPPAAKKRYSDLVEAIRHDYSLRIDRLDWMSAATKAKSQRKLAALTKKVGYPDKWKDYSALNVGTDSFCSNMMNAARWRFDDMVSKFGKPVDRTEWDMTPQTFNAYYNPSNNEIVLPAAGFALPGMRDSQIDDALMFGNAGAGWIGHEMTHGFDDQGRQYDPKGNLSDWWTKEDAARFQTRANVMVKEFNAYEPLPGIHVNGKASLGENIADYGGILLGLDAFKKTATFRSGKKVAGFTPLQRFFLGYAVGWRYETTTQQLRRSLLSDVHAPAKWRVIGPLSNIPDFYKAFGIKPGQPMWRAPKDRVHIW